MYKKTRHLPVCKVDNFSHYLSRLIDDLIAISNYCNQYLSVYGFPRAVPPEDELTHDYWRVQRLGLGKSCEIGVIWRREGGVLSETKCKLIMDTYLDVIEENWQRKRRVRIGMPSLGQIAAAVYNNNTLITNNGIYMYVKETEGDDDYGNLASHAKYKYIGGLLPKNTYFIGSDFYIVRQIYKCTYGCEPHLNEWPSEFSWMLE